MDDEILAIDDYRVRADGFEGQLEVYQLGEAVSLLVARREKLRRLDVMLGAEPERPCRLEADPDATEEQKARLVAWLCG